MLALYPYQEKGAEFLGIRNGAILGDDPGLGKTAQAICAAKENHGPVLIISRPLNKWFWEDEINRWDPDNVGIVVCGPGGVFDEETVKTWFEVPRKRGYLIIHHEALATPKKTVKGVIVGVQRDLAKKLRSYGLWEVIIADECHRFKSPKAQMTKALKTISSFHRWGLTGTPIDKTPADMWSILNWFDKFKFKSYWDFFDAYTQYTIGAYGRRTILGPRNLAMFKREVGPYYLARKRDEVLPDLPEIIHSHIPLEMTPDQRRIYDEFKTKTFVHLQTLLQTSDAGDPVFVKNALARIGQLRRVALNPMLVDAQVVGCKIPWILEWAEEYPDVPFVVFTHSRMFADTLPILIDRCATISGSVPQSQRDMVMSRFQNGDLRAIVGTIDTMSESVNLQRAKVAIFTDLHWSSIAMTQAEFRIARMDSKHPVQLIKLSARGSVDELIAKALALKFNTRQMVEEFLKEA